MGGNQTVISYVAFGAAYANLTLKILNHIQSTNELQCGTMNDIKDLFLVPNVVSMVDYREDCWLSWPPRSPDL